MHQELYLFLQFLLIFEKTYTRFALIERFSANSIYDADIAKNYDRVSPLAQIQKPRETIKM